MKRIINLLTLACIIGTMLSVFLVPVNTWAAPAVDSDEIKNLVTPSDRVYPGLLLWPIPGKTPLAKVTSHVGWRNAKKIHDNQGGTWASWIHHGIDVGKVKEKPVVVASAPGKATAGYRKGSGYYVIIDHGNGWFTKYQHLSKFAGKIYKGCAGIEVDVGEEIGYVGSSGGSYPVHFHFEIAYDPSHKGKASDYHTETYNKVVYAYSRWQGKNVKLTWAKNWEICTGENQRFVATKEELYKDYKLFKQENKPNKAFVLSSDTYKYSKPSVVSSEQNTNNLLKKDFGVITIGSCKGTDDNYVWYITQDFRFVRADCLNMSTETDVDETLDKGTKISDISVIVKQTKYDTVWMRDKPYADAVRWVPVRRDEQLKTKAIYKNKYNNYWVEFENGYFLCGDNVKLVNPCDSNDILINGVSYEPLYLVTDGSKFPSGNLTKGKSFDLRGTVNSPYKIKSAQAAVYKGGFLSIITEAQSSLVTINQKSFDLHSSNINIAKNGGIAFESLSEGLKAFKLVIIYERPIWKDVSDTTANPVSQTDCSRTFYSIFTVGKGKDNEDNASGANNSIQATGISLSASSATISKGETYSLKATVTPSDTTKKDVVWSTSNASVATVSEGKVKGVGKGTATITAKTTDGSNRTATCTVTVKQPVTEISITPTTLTMYAGNTAQQLTAAVKPADANNKAVTWSSSNTGVVTVDSSGKVTAKAAGTATVTAKANDGSGKQGACTVTVRSYVDSITVTGSNTVNVGLTISLSAGVSPANAYNKTVTWTSGDPTIATVDSNGQAKGIKPGSVTITARAADRGTKTGSRTITVRQPVTGISLTGSAYILKGNQTTISATVSPSNASNKTLSWSSENPAIAEVNNGVVTAKAAGSTTIKAAATDGSGKTAGFHVTVQEPVSGIMITGEEVVPVDGTISLTATASPENADNQRVSWSTDDGTIATINDQGVLKGLQAGPVTVTATATDGSGITADHSVQVVKQLVAVQIDGDNTVYTGEEKQLSATVSSDQSLDDDGVIWSSSDESVVTVTSDGTIRGIGNGSAVITATSRAENYYSAGHTVTVTTLVNGIAVSGETFLDEGRTAQFSVNISPATATNQNVAWTSSNTDVADVDGNGMVYAVSEGTAIITATAADESGISGTAELTVYPLPHSITVDGTDALKVGETTQLNAAVLPENARNKTVLWMSDDETIATVDTDGVVTAVGNGTAVITGTAQANQDVSESCQITVTTPVSSIELTSPDLIDVGETDTVLAEILPATASNRELVWASSDEEVAVVDDSGHVTGLSPGLVIITATATDGSEVSAGYEIEIFQPVQSISIDMDPVVYTGQLLEPEITVYPEDATIQEIHWTVSDDNVIAVEEMPENDMDETYEQLTAVSPGIVKLTAHALDGSEVTGFTYVEVDDYTELNRDTLTYDLYSAGTGKEELGTVALTSGTVSRAADDGYGAVWNIEHISGDYAATIGITEQSDVFNGRSLANRVELNLLGINKTGSDVYRISCTINGYTDTCQVNVNVSDPEKPLPETVTLQQNTYYAGINEEIEVSTVPVCSPLGSELPAGMKRYLDGAAGFYRYAEISTGDDAFTVQFSKAGTYKAKIRFYGANYTYEDEATFVITNNNGTTLPETEELSFDNSVVYMVVNETHQLNVNISPANADENALIWSSSDTSVAQVDQDGTVTACSQGYAVITVSADNGVNASATVFVSESLMCIDWNEEETIHVFLGGQAKTVIQRIYLTSRASETITNQPTWKLKRESGNNLTLLCSPITGTGADGETLYGCEIILKSVSATGVTEYELSCSDGEYETRTMVKVEAHKAQDTLPSTIQWQNTVFTGGMDQLMTIQPDIQCWPETTGLPNEATISLEGDSYWNDAVNRSDVSISRKIFTFSFHEPGIYTANCIYSCANMRYPVLFTVRIADENGVVPVRAMSLTLNENEISLKAGTTAQLKAIIAPEDATNKAVSWSSENPSVATVNEDGLITAAANGTTNIWCIPEDTNCAAVKCVTVVEDEFTVIQTDEMNTQYLQGEPGNTVASFRLSNGTARRLEEAGTEPVWSFSRISGNAAEADLIENNGIRYLVVTELLHAGTDVYEVSCSTGESSWTGRATLTINDQGSPAPETITLAQTSYTAAVGEEIELDFTPVCGPNGTGIPATMRSNYIGIGQFYDGLAASYKSQIMTTKNDKVKVAFTKKGTYLLSRYYRDRNLTFVTECTIRVGDGPMNLLKCSDREATVYIGGKPGIAATCVIADTTVEELYGDELVWTAERLNGDCLLTALRADQSSASLFVADATETGEELWRVSCSFRGITDSVDISIQAVEPENELPESVSLRQTEFSGMIGNAIKVPLATQCEPEGAGLPSIADEAWRFAADGNTEYYATWTIADNCMSIRFRESGYYGGRLIYEAGNVSYSFPISFAITDEESVLLSPTHMDVSLSAESMTVFPEGETDVPVVNAVLSDSLDAYSLASIAAYAQSKDAAWNMEILSGDACELSLRKVSAAALQIIAGEITGSGDVNYRISCTVEGNQYSAEGTIHVASDEEERPRAELKQDYFLTQPGTMITIDASFYDKTGNLKLCAGRDSIWENCDALAAMGYDYQLSGDLWMPVFHQTGSYTTTVINRLSNLPISQEIRIVVHNLKTLPDYPTILRMPAELQEIDAEAFAGISTNIIDLRGTKIRTIRAGAFANITGLIRVYIPPCVKTISPDVFDGCKDIEIFCVQGSDADIWGREAGCPVYYDVN